MYERQYGTQKSDDFAKVQLSEKGTMICYRYEH